MHRHFPLPFFKFRASFKNSTHSAKELKLFITEKKKMKAFTKSISKASTTNPSFKGRTPSPCIKGFSKSAFATPKKTALFSKPAIAQRFSAQSSSRGVSYKKPSSNIINLSKKNTGFIKPPTFSARQSQRFSSQQQHEMISGLPSYLTLIPETRLSQLDNSLRIASQASNSQIVTLSVFVDAGSALENEANNGVAHFLVTKFLPATLSTRLLLNS